MGGGQDAPQAYTPANQAGADSAYYSTLTNLTSQNQTAADTAATGFNDIYSTIKANPFNGQAVAGAQQEATGTQNVLNNVNSNPYNPAALAGASAAVPAYQNIFDSTTSNPLLTAAQGGALAAGRGAAGTADFANNPASFNMSTGAAGSAIGGLGTAAANIQNNPYTPEMFAALKAIAGQSQGVGQQQIDNAKTLYGYADPLIQAGFDPQGANYNYQLQQTRDLANVENAQAGVAGSPFGAGVTNEATGSFNRNWEAGKSNRMNQAIAALASLFLAGGQLGDAGLSTQATGAALPASAYQEQQVAAANANSQLSAAAAVPEQIAAQQTASQIAAQDSQMRQALAQAGLTGQITDQQLQALTALVTGQQLPAQVYGGQQQQVLDALSAATTGAAAPANTFNATNSATLAALQALVQGNATASAPLQNDVSSFGNYLNIGQNATKTNQDAAKINNSSGGLLGGLGQLFGLAASSHP